MNAITLVPVQLDKGLQLHLWRLIFLRSVMRCITIGILTVLPIYVVLALPKGGWVALLPIPIGGAVGLFMVLGIQWLSLARRSDKVFEESAYLQSLFQFSADDAGFSFTWDRGHSYSSWVDMVKWDETDEIFAIFQNRMMANILPKDQLGVEAIAFVRDRLVASGLSKPGKMRK